jgi:transposase
MQAKGRILAKSFRKLDPQKVRKLKQQGLTNTQIAQRLGVTQGAIYHVLRKLDTGETDSNALQPETVRLAPDLP